LVGSHSPPVIGGSTISKILQNYRDTIAFVYDQTIAKINLGMEPNDIADSIILPEHLAEDPFVQEFYGTLKWSSKAIFTEYLGWFSGNIVDLDSLSELEFAKRFIKLAGGEYLAITKAVESLNEGTLEGAQFALEIATALNRVVTRDSEFLPYVYDIIIQAAKILGFSNVSANGRNYYLNTIEKILASEQPNSMKFYDDQLQMEILQSYYELPSQVFMEILSTKLNYEKTKEIHFTAKLTLEVSKEDNFLLPLVYFVNIRQGIMECYPSSFRLTKRYKPDLEISVTYPSAFKSLILQVSTVQEELHRKTITSHDSEEKIAFFFDLFK